jgi:hypothetical protein
MKSSLAILFSLGLFTLAALPLMGQQEWVRDSAYLDQGIPQTTDFENIIRVYFEEYDADGRPLEIRSQLENPMGSWENWRRRTFTYDDGSPTMILTQYWDTNEEEWQALAERTYTYDGMGNRLTKTIRRAPEMGAPLEETRKWTYTYNGVGNQEAMLYQEWNGTDWENISRQNWSYNTEERLEEQLLQLWDGSSWQDARRRMWSYDPDNGLLDGVIAQQWDEDTQAWVNTDRREYFNTNPVNWSGFRESTWDVAEDEWINQRQEIYNYQGIQFLESRIIQEWEDDTWQNQFQLSYSAEIGLISVLGEVWDDGNEDWSSYARHQFFYEDLNRVVEDLGWQFWNPDMEIWENDDLTFRRRHFWSQASVATQEILIPDNCLIPNPYPLNTPFFCASLPQGEQMELRLVSTSGQLVYSTSITGGGPFQINKALPSGMYFLQIRGPQAIHHLQKLMIVNE